MRSTFKLLYFVKRNAVKKNGNAPIIAIVYQKVCKFYLFFFLQIYSFLIK